MEILNVFKAKIVVETVAFLFNVAVILDIISVVAIVVGRICVDFDSVITVDKTAKVIDIVLGMVKE